MQPEANEDEENLAAIHEAHHRVDAMLDAVVDLTTVVKEIVHTQRNSNTQTIVHQGMGMWGIAAIVACFATWVMLIVMYLLIVPDIHDVKAWQDILRKDVAKLQAESK